MSPNANVCVYFEYIHPKAVKNVGGKVVPGYEERKTALKFQEQQNNVLQWPKLMTIPSHVLRLWNENDSI